MPGTAPRTTPTTLTDLTVDELADAAETTWTTWPVLPTPSAPALFSTIDQAIAHMRKQNAGRAPGAGLDLTSIVRSVAHETDLTRYTDAETAQRINQARSAVGTIVGAAALNQDDSVSAAFANLPSVVTRAGGRARPLHDDEIVLTRLVVLAAARSSDLRRHGTAFTYLGVEAGAYPAETTHLTPGHYDDPHEPTSVNFGGVTNLAGPRTRPLDEFARAVLLLLPELTHHREDTLLAYTGRAPAGSPAASTSASKRLERVLADAGWTMGTPASIHTIASRSQNLEPSSILKWRLAYVTDNEGPVAACRALGWPDDGSQISRLYRLLDRDLRRIERRSESTAKGFIDRAVTGPVERAAMNTTS